MRSPVESSMSSSRGFGAGETSPASARSESVDFPIADTVPTTFRPRRLAATKRVATCRTLSASATEEPPNFITTVSTAGGVIAAQCMAGRVLRDEARPAVRPETGRDGNARAERRVGDGLERLHDEREVPGPDVEVGVGRVAVLRAADADLRRRLVERQREDRGRPELLPRRLPCLVPAPREELLGERLERRELLRRARRPASPCRGRPPSGSSSSARRPTGRARSRPAASP